MEFEGWQLALGAVAVAAALVSAAVEARDRRPRRGRSTATPPAVASSADPDPGHHAVVCCTGPDTVAAERLAVRLRAEGLRVLLARRTGQGLAESLDADMSLRAPATGLLVLGSATLDDAAVRDAYAALLRQDRSGGQRFVPVLVDDAELPPFTRSHHPVDLRNPGSAPYEKNLAALVRALRSRSDTE
jgi:hypothetical protein